MGERGYSLTRDEGEACYDANESEPRGWGCARMGIPYNADGVTRMGIPIKI